jgi:hypothetical protein
MPNVDREMVALPRVYVPLPPPTPPPPGSVDVGGTVDGDTVSGGGTVAVAVVGGGVDTPGRVPDAGVPGGSS